MVLLVLQENCDCFANVLISVTEKAGSLVFVRRYSPAVLLLRRFGALMKSLAGGGQDQSKNVSLIGNALRDGIQAHLNQEIEGEEEEDDEDFDIGDVQEKEDQRMSKVYASVGWLCCGRLSQGYGLHVSMVLKKFRTNHYGYPLQRNF